MSLSGYSQLSLYPPFKRRRRTATSVLAGDFDPRPVRDVLTSLLNGVEPYKAVENEEETKRLKKMRKKERKRAKIAARKELAVAGSSSQAVASSSATASSIRGSPLSGFPVVNHSTSSFWRARGPAAPPTRSISPSPLHDILSQPSTPDPSISSSISFTSSKRPHTPEDDHSYYDLSMSPQLHLQQEFRPRKKRVAVKKGWKGWVEGSPPPSEKLINLDSAPILKERRLRSGKNFDAISVGQDGWV